MSDEHSHEEHNHSHEGHDHNHSHGHHHHHVQGEKGLVLSIIINAGITAAEIIGGILSGSLALLSDAFHNLSDVISLIISYIAILIGKKTKSLSKTYGYKRAEILAALINVLALFFVCGYIIFEAIERFQHPQPIKVGLMLAIAAIGLLGNGISVLLLFKDAKENINIKSAFLHLMADTISSVAVIVTAIILMFKPWYILDAAISVIIAVYIAKESFSILMETLNILMQGAPKNLDDKKIKQRLKEETSLGIIDVHHIHMWEISPGKVVFDAHVAVPKDNLKNADAIIHGINIILAGEFKICHSTIQLESEEFDHCISCDI
ncbi:MAG: cation transporter [Candidatus Goldiibacteriota bacterium HGW-Goldbacteria-1]|jgi:cobalt-zinc-cadmium efflux system protein|nr:MAG: cation transporter [Candidatus Goldiibacteriota bacterium HGW-Goldbacteria-1]